jgi:hypothetical protein
MTVKKWVALCVVCGVAATGAFADLDVGITYVPGSVIKTEENQEAQEFFKDESIFGDNILGFHVGYSWWWLFYAGWDSYMMPPWWIQSRTEYVRADGTLAPGAYAPGFLNLFGAGLRPTIGPLSIMATVGVNHIYVHSDYDTRGEEERTLVGLNARVGAGWRFGPLRLTVVGTSLYATPDQVAAMIKSIERAPKAGLIKFVESLVPSLVVSVDL